MFIISLGIPDVANGVLLSCRNKIASAITFNSWYIAILQTVYIVHRLIISLGYLAQ